MLDQFPGLNWGSKGDLGGLRPSYKKIVLKIPQISGVRSVRFSGERCKISGVQEVQGTTGERGVGYESMVDKL